MNSQAGTPSQAKFTVGKVKDHIYYNSDACIFHLISVKLCCRFYQVLFFSSFFTGHWWRFWVLCPNHIFHINSVVVTVGFCRAQWCLRIPPRVIVDLSVWYLKLWFWLRSWSEWVQIQKRPRAESRGTSTLTDREEESAKESSEQTGGNPRDMLF